MKRIAFLLSLALMVPAVAFSAKKEKAPKALKTVNYENVKIYAQSGRNSQKRGSAVSLIDGRTMALEDGVNDTRAVDIMLFYGKVDHSKTKFFTMFAPGNPTLNIDWEKDGGTSPYCKFEGKSDDPDAYYALKNWKKRNETKMEKVEGIDFDAATGEQINSLSVSDSYWVKDVKVGDVILFELGETSYKAGHKGLIKVVALEDDETKPEKKGVGQNQRLVLSIKYVK